MSPGVFFFASGYTLVKRSWAIDLPFEYRWQYTSHRKENQGPGTGRLAFRRGENLLYDVALLLAVLKILKKLLRLFGGLRPCRTGQDPDRLVAAVGLGVIKSLVGQHHDLLEIVLIRFGVDQGKSGIAHGTGLVDLRNWAFGKQEGLLGDLRQDLRSEKVQIGDIRILQHDQELFPPGPDHDVVQADRAFQKLREFRQKAVPRLMPEAVVELFEMVDVQHEDAEDADFVQAPPAFPGQKDILLEIEEGLNVRRQDFRQETPVAEARKRVRQAHFSQFMRLLFDDPFQFPSAAFEAGDTD